MSTTTAATVAAAVTSTAAATAAKRLRTRLVDHEGPAAESAPLKRSIAACASSSDCISTKANPRARPVAMSRITRTDSIVPA